MFPDVLLNEREKTEEIIQSAKKRSLTRVNLSQKILAASHKNQPREKKSTEHYRV